MPEPATDHRHGHTHDRANPAHALVAEVVGRDRTVLDLGCGDGRLGALLTEQGCRVVGVERDPEAAETAKARLDRVVVVDLEDGSVADVLGGDRFDVVVLCGVLEHLADPGAVLAQATALLSAEGRLVAVVPNAAHGARRLAALQGHIDDGHGHHHFTPESLAALLGAAGLVTETLTGTLADPLAVGGVEDDHLPDGLVEWVRDQPDALVHQVLGLARRAAHGEVPGAAPRLRPDGDPAAARRTDRHTEARVEAQRAELIMRDHVLGLQAEATAAQQRAWRQAQRVKQLQARLKDRNQEIAGLKEHIRRLETGLARRVARRLLR